MTKAKWLLEDGSIDLARIGRLLSQAWWGYRLVYAVALAIFVSLYAFLAIQSDYEVQPAGLIVQVILLAALIAAWRATGHPIRPLWIASLIVLVVFALTSATIAVVLVIRPDAIVEQSQNFPDPRWHTFLARIDPHGPFIVLFVVLGGLAIALAISIIAALILRFRHVNGTGATLLALDRRVRSIVAQAGDAPSLMRRLTWSRRAWAMGALVLFAVLLPLFLPERKLAIQVAGGGAYGSPGELAARVVALLDHHFTAIVLAGIAAFMIWRVGLALLMPVTRRAITTDERPPILLLRAFQDDPAAIAPVALWPRLLHPLLLPVRAALAGLGATPALNVARAATRCRLEQVAAGCLSDTGPFIAIGDPQARQPELGALRPPLSDEEWQDHVKRWLREARLVLLVVGATEWVSWELQMAAELDVLRKVVLLIPPGEASEIAARWRHVARCLDGTLWHPVIIMTDPQSVLAVCFAENGKLLTITSASRDARDYDLAMRIGQAMVLA